MKKLLLVISATAISATVFANPVIESAQASATTPAATAFNSNAMKCGDKVIGAKDNVDSLSQICKGFKFGKGKAIFLDENSGKQVVCSVKKADLVLATCQTKP